MIAQDIHFVLFSNCLISRGAGRALLCDLQNEHFIFLPLALVSVLKKAQKTSVHRLLHQYPDHVSYLQDFLHHLVESNYGFFTKEPQLFPKMNLEWKSPNTITNAILELNSNNLENGKRALDALHDLGCIGVQCRFDAPVSLSALYDLFEGISDSRIRHIELMFPWYEDLDAAALDVFLKKHLRISFVLCFGASAPEYSFTTAKVIFSQKKQNTALYCGTVSELFFSPNLPTFTESQHHNSCLNRKISIDANGNIKNCPSMAQSFGNIKDTTLQEALDHPEFKKYWNITKDQIAVCKDCEFRYICTDCRAYLENPHDMYAKPLKCGYNPYTCEWEEWSTNPLKQQAIDFYGMRDVLPEFKMKPDYVPPRTNERSSYSAQ